MFTKDELLRVLELQNRSYELFQWVGSAVRRGFISFDAAHTYSSAPEAAEAWIQGHYLNIPAAARPLQADLRDFSAFFATYLENSFEFPRQPGKRLYSPDDHCFCPMCSWLVDAPNLKTRTPDKKDKARARKMVREAINRAAKEESVLLSESAAEAIANDPTLREDLALCAYAHDLFGRVRGNAVGPAALVLWRTFAWLPTGSPKKKFRLTADLILKAENSLRSRLRSVGDV